MIFINFNTSLLKLITLNLQIFKNLNFIDKNLSDRWDREMIDAQMYLLFLNMFEK